MQDFGQLPNVDYIIAGFTNVRGCRRERLDYFKTLSNTYRKYHCIAQGYNNTTSTRTPFGLAHECLANASYF